MFGQDCGFCAERVGSLFSVASSNLLSSEPTKQSPRVVTFLLAVLPKTVTQTGLLGLSPQFYSKFLKKM
ncbi:hypothetical protein LP7551_02773 [Roseibium album]|nr:hypothetical protein LP7551_02773 [Roseibium album]